MDVYTHARARAHTHTHTHTHAHVSIRETAILEFTSSGNGAKSI